MADMYDEMAEDMEAEDMETEDMETEEAETPEHEVDEEFRTLAEAAGIPADKVESFKLAIEKCVELREAGMYGADEEMALEDDEEA